MRNAQIATALDRPRSVKHAIRRKKFMFRHKTDDVDLQLVGDLFQLVNFK